MNLKLLKLHWKLFFWFFTGRLKKISSRLDINFTKGNPEKILVFFPMEEPSFRVALYAFRNIGKNNPHKIKFKFIVKEKFKQLFHLQIGDTVYIQNTEFNKLLPDEKYLRQSLKTDTFDIIVDLNPTFHLGIAGLINALASEMKVGFSSRFSDRFYNIQLDISQTGIMEKGFQQINLILSQ